MAADIRWLVIGTACMAVAACAKPPAAPEQTARVPIDRLTCAQLAIERQSIQARLQDEASREAAREEASGNNNIGIMIFPALRPDQPRGAGNDLAELREREQRLDTVIARKKCP